MSEALKPLVGLSADCKEINGLPFHAVGDKYVRAVAEAADAVPFLIPAIGGLHDLEDLVRRLDGLVLTGSPSNVHPRHYGLPASLEAEPHDEPRDETFLPLIRLALERGLPLLAICRGFQELNVALGGTLHARLHEVAGRQDHRRPQHEDFGVQYGPKHLIRLTPGGPFAELAGATEIEVNSLHNQGIDRLSEALEVEAVAEDGTVEAVSVRGAGGFALGVQWHPEYKAMENEFSRRLFGAFGEAARRRAETRAKGRFDPVEPLMA